MWTKCEKYDFIWYSASSSSEKAAYFVGRTDVTREFAYTIDVTLLLQQLLGNRPKIRVATPKLIVFLARFSSFLREQKENMYLTETPVILNAAKLEKALGTIPFSDRTESVRVRWTG